MIFVPKPRPAFAKTFTGNAKCFPAEDTYFLQYQAEWIKDGSLEKMQEKSRRVGISFATAYERVQNHAKQETTLDTWISSRDEMTARLFVKDCLKFAKVINTAAKDQGASIMEDEKHQRHTVHALAFDNSTMLNSVASNADVFAGKGGDVIVDEIALRKDPEYVMGIGLSTTDWGGRMASISTHRGSRNAFAQRIAKVRDGREPVNGIMKGRGDLAHVTLHRVTLEYALQCGFLYKLQSKLKPGDPRLAMDEAAYMDYIKSRSPNNEIYLQEYCCIPEDDAAAFLGYDLIDANGYEIGEVWQIPPGENLKGRRFTMGLDIGRDIDLTVFWIDEWIGKSAFTREVVEMQGVKFSLQEAEMDRLWAKYQPVRGLGDRNGIGRQLCERAEERYGKARFQGINFTPDSKSELAYLLKKAFEDRRTRNPRDEKIVADFRSIKKELTASGGERFYADRGKNGHADRFWARALSYRAGIDGETVMQFKPVRQHHGKRSAQRYRQI